MNFRTALHSTLSCTNPAAVGAASAATAALRCRIIRAALAVYTCTAMLVLGGCAPADPLQQAAEDYVQLALALDAFKDGEVDSWFGPPELQQNAVAAEPAALLTPLATLRSELDSISSESPRLPVLQQKVAQLQQVVALLAADAPPSFADEAQQLYGITLPQQDVAAVQQQIFAELEALLPGSGSLARRVANFRKQLLIPAEQRRPLFERALAECRARTLQHWSLPAEEALALEWSRDVSTPWHRYDGHYHSTLQLNDLTLAYVSTVVDVACHEGYPGHHAQFVLFEQAADGALPLEQQLVLLRSPESALREATAELGVAVALPPEERLQFEREVLYPLAGLDPALADTNLRINALLGRLALITVPLLQQYRDGAATYNATTFELDREALVSSPAETLRFVDDYGAYSVSYTVLREQLQGSIGSGDSAWDQLARLLRAPASALPPDTGNP